jgi:hypothetical protein
MHQNIETHTQALSLSVTRNLMFAATCLLVGSAWYAQAAPPAQSSTGRALKAQAHRRGGGSNAPAGMNPQQPQGQPQPDQDDEVVDQAEPPEQQEETVPAIPPPPQQPNQVQPVTPPNGQMRTPQEIMQEMQQRQLLQQQQMQQQMQQQQQQGNPTAPQQQPENPE